MLPTVPNYFAVPLEWAMSSQEQGDSVMQSPVPAHLCARLHAHAPGSMHSAPLCGTAMLPMCGMQSGSSEVFLHLYYFYALSW